MIWGEQTPFPLSVLTARTSFQGLPSAQEVRPEDFPLT